MYLNTSSLELSEEFPSDLKTSSNQATMYVNRVVEALKFYCMYAALPGGAGTCSLVPLKYFSIFPSFVPQNQNLNFLCSLLPKITFVPLFPSFLDLSSRSSEINDIIPLFPINPGRTSCMFQVLPCVCISVKKLENANALVENTASYLEL